MKLPLKFGLPILVAIWVVHGFVEDENTRTFLLVAAMAVALWTAFSLNIPPRRKGDAAETGLQLEEEEEEDESAPRGDDDGGNGEPEDRGRPLN
jgi:hypothetical protein